MINFIPIKFERVSCLDDSFPPQDFLELIKDKFSKCKQDMESFFLKACEELDSLYKNISEKTIDFTNSKFNKINELYTRNNIKHSKSEKIKNHFNLNNLLDIPLLLKNTISQKDNIDIHANSFDIFDRINRDSKLNNLDTERLYSGVFSNISASNENKKNYDSKQNSSNFNLNSDEKKNTKIPKEQVNQKDISDRNDIEKIELTKLKDFLNNNIIEKLNSMFELKANLMNSIQQNFLLIKRFLDGFDYNNINPLQDYIDKNAKLICDSWFLPKNNFENLNMACFIKNPEIPNAFKNFIISDDSKNKFTSFTIEKTEKTKNFEFERRVIKNNSSILTKLDLISFKSKEDLNKIFYEKENFEFNFKKMKKLNFKNCTLENFDHYYSFGKLQKLNFQNSRFIEIPLNLSDNFTFLKEICFINCNLKNSNVLNLMEEFKNLEILETINLSSNNLTVFPTNEQFVLLKNLKNLILRKNKISKLTLNRDAIAKFFPKLELLDLYANNICHLQEIEFKPYNKSGSQNVLILLGRNLYLQNNSDLMKKYLKYLFSYLENSNANIKYLDLSYLLYNKNNYPEYNLKNLKINLNIQMSLSKIDLSYNNLIDEDLDLFYKNNYGLVNLNKIILNNNKFSERVFKYFMNKNKKKVFEKLKFLLLNGNSIRLSSIENLERVLDDIIRVLDDNINLKEIKIENNPFKEDIEECYKKKDKSSCESIHNFLKKIQKKKNLSMKY